MLTPPSSLCSAHRLIILDLSGNPVCSSDDYRVLTLYHSRRLKVLDGRPVDAAEQAAAKAKYSGRLTLDFLEEQLGHTQYSAIRSLDLSGLKIRDVGSVFTAGGFDLLQQLVLDNNALSSLTGITHLRNLRVLKASNNRLNDESAFASSISASGGEHAVCVVASSLDLSLRGAFYSLTASAVRMHNLITE